MKFCDYMNEDWFKKLEREVAASNKTQVAKKMGIARPTLSLVMNGESEYGTGKSSTRKIETRFRQVYEQLECTFNQRAVGIAYCREMALTSAPTQNPIKMMHWQACQACAFKPKALVEVKAIKVTKSIKEPKQFEALQQAGIVDKVTLPLPVVGAPQIQHNDEVVTC